MLVIGEELFGAGHVAGRAFQFNAVGAQIDVDVQAVFEHVEIFVASAEQGFDVRAEFNILFHSGLMAPPPAAGLGSLFVSLHQVSLHWDS